MLGLPFYEKNSKNKGILCVDTDKTSIGWLDGEYKGRCNPKKLHILMQCFYIYYCNRYYPAFREVDWLKLHDIWFTSVSFLRAGSSESPLSKYNWLCEQCVCCWSVADNASLPQSSEDMRFWSAITGPWISHESGSLMLFAPSPRELCERQSVRNEAA